MKSTKRVNRVELYPESSTHRVKERNIRIFYKTGTADDGWIQVTGWNFTRDDKNGSLSFTFKEAVEARYIKVVTDWDDRNYGNESIENYATFKGTPRNLLRVWTLSSNLAETYGYDTAGNRVSLTTGDTGGSSSYAYTYYANTQGGNSTRVLYDGRWYYTYDANGNRTTRGKVAAVSGNNVVIDTTAEYWTYTWDLHNRLTAVKQYNAPDKGTCVSVAYTYDALNYRIERMGSDGTTVYAYGRSGALTYQKTTGTTGTTMRSYAYLNNEVIGWTETDTAGHETKLYAVTDMLGSVTKVLDKTGRVLWSSEYTAFGNVAGTVTDAIDFSGLYTGKDIDAETGLTYHWNRWRSEDGSCFISEDPARDGSNWYGYCGNNPMTYTDPTGLAPYVNGVYDGPYDPDHQTPEVTYGPEYKSGTYSGPQSPTSFDTSSFTSFAEHQMGLLVDVTTAYFSNAGRGFADSAAGFGYSLWHPVKTAKTLWNEVVQTVAHPVLTAQGIWGGWKSGISDFMQADAAGRAGIIGETAGRNGFDVTLAVLAAEAPSVVHNIRAGVAGKVSLNTEKIFYRSMSRAEADAVTDTGILRGGRPGDTFFTDSRFRTASRAQNRLSLPSTPEVQMEFKLTNNPNMIRNGTRVTPAYGGIGGGREFMTTDPVSVEVINVQPY